MDWRNRRVLRCDLYIVRPVAVWRIDTAIAATDRYEIGRAAQRKRFAETTVGIPTIYRRELVPAPRLR